MPMFVYLDESGDHGFKFRKGSSRWFVVTLLLVNDQIPIQATIDDLRRELGFGPFDEFKFSHSADDVKRRFLHELRRHDFRVRAIAIDKTLMTRPHMHDRDTFYRTVVRLVLRHDNRMISDATLVVDESIKSRRRQRAFGSYLRQALNEDPNAPKIAGIAHHESHRDNLIQATDMVCGAIYASFTDNDDEYLRIVRTKIDDIWEWRPRETQ